MSDTTRARLRTTLVDQYERLRSGLAARLGSRDLASEALHEMWLKLNDGGDLAPVADAPAYVFRGAMNAAKDLEAANRRTLSHIEITTILELADPMPGPDRVAEARSELRELQKALRSMKPRQREIFVAVLYEETDHETLAERYDVSVRMIQMELRNAILHCARRTGRKELLRDGALRVSRR